MTTRFNGNVKDSIEIRTGRLRECGRFYSDVARVLSAGFVRNPLGMGQCFLECGVLEEFFTRPEASVFCVFIILSVCILSISFNMLSPFLSLLSYINLRLSVELRPKQNHRNTENCREPIHPSTNWNYKYSECKTCQAAPRERNCIHKMPHSKNMRYPKQSVKPQFIVHFHSDMSA